ncbi:MAG: hypothetical protein IJQ88_06935, partial [Clostridia bacterium]|nr:hypothetical protein [Clostridia bacterium]
VPLSDGFLVPFVPEWKYYNQVRSPRFPLGKGSIKKASDQPEAYDYRAKPDLAVGAGMTARKTYTVRKTGKRTYNV